jgi:TP901 family phage tail tape measure protein
MSGFTIPLVVSGYESIGAATSAIAKMSKENVKSLEAQEKAATKFVEAMEKIKDAGGKVELSAEGTKATQFYNLMKRTQELMLSLDKYAPLSKLEKQFQTLSIEGQRWNDKLAKMNSDMRVALHAKEADIAATEKQRKAYATAAAELANFDSKMYRHTQLKQLSLYAEKLPIDAATSNAKALLTERQRSADLAGPQVIATEQLKIQNKATLEAATLTAKLAAETSLLNAQRSGANTTLIQHNEILKLENKATVDLATVSTKLAAQRDLLAASRLPLNAAMQKSIDILKAESRATEQANTFTTRQTATLAELRRIQDSYTDGVMRQIEVLKVRNAAAATAATAEEKEKATLQELRRQIDEYNTGLGKLIDLAKLEVKALSDAATFSDRKRIAMEALDRELKYLVTDEGKAAAAGAVRLKGLNDEATFTERMANKTAEAARALAFYTTDAGKAQVVTELQAQSAKRLAGIRQTEINKLAELKAHMTALTSAEKQEFAALTEREKLEKEKARLIARSTTAMKALIAEVNALKVAESSATPVGEKFSLKMHLAAQGAAAMRSAIYGLGASFGIFTSATLLVASATFAVTSAFRMAITEAVSYEAALSALGAMSSTNSAASEAYAKDLQELNKAVMDSAASSRFTTIETADAMKQLALAGLTAQQAIAATPSTMALATVGAMDFAQAAEIATNVMMGFGLQVKDLPGIVDILSKAATESNSNVQELGTAMSYAAPLASAFGVSLEYTAAAMEVLANAGIKGSRAGTGMRKILISLFTPTQKAADLMKSYGVELGKVADGTESLESLDKFAGVLAEGGEGAAKAQKMLEEFYIATAGGTQNLQLLREAVGVYALPAMTQLVKSVGLGTKSVQQLAASLSDASGSAEQQMTKMLDNLQAVWDQLKAAASVLSTKLYDEEASGIKKMLEDLLGVVRALADSDSIARKFIDAALALAIAIGKIVAAMLAWKLAVMSGHVAIAAFTKAKDAVLLLQAALLGIPKALAAVKTAALSAGAAVGLLGKGAAGKDRLVLGSLGAGGAAAAGAAGGLAGLVTGGLAAAAVGTAAYLAFDWLFKIPEAANKAADAYKEFNDAVATGSETLRGVYDYYVVGKELEELYKKRDQYEQQMIALAGKNADEAERIRSAYESVVGEIDRANTSLKAFSNSGMNVMIDAAEAKLRAQEAKVIETAAALRSAQENRPGMLSWGTTIRQAEKDEATLVKSLELQRATAEQLQAELELLKERQRIFKAGTEEERLAALGIAYESVGRRISNLSKDIAEMEQQRRVLDPNYNAAAYNSAVGLMEKLQEEQRSLNALREAGDRQAAMSVDEISKQKKLAAEQDKKDYELLAGTKEQRDAAELQRAQDLADKTAEAVKKAKELSDATERAAQANPADSAATKAFLDANAAARKAIADDKAAQAELNKLKEASAKADNSAAKGMNGLVKSAAEYYEILRKLNQEFVSFIAGMTEFSQTLLDKGVDVFDELMGKAQQFRQILSLTTLSGTQLPGVQTPATATPATGNWASAINPLAAKYGVDPALVQAVIKQESGGNPAAVSGAGAVGLMQLMPGTASDMGVTNRYDPMQNLEGGIKYLALMLKMFSGDVTMALAAYNAGPGKVRSVGGVPQNGETPEYVRNVTKNYSGLSSDEKKLALTDEAKSVSTLVVDYEKLNKLMESGAALDYKGYDAKEYLAQSLEKEQKLRASVIPILSQALEWEARLQDKQAQTPANLEEAGKVLQKLKAAWEAYDKQRQVSIKTEERAIQRGQEHVALVARTPEELRTMAMSYDPLIAATEKFNLVMAQTNLLLEKGTGDQDALKQAQKDAANGVLAAKGEYEKFFSGLDTGWQGVEKAYTSAMGSMRDTIASALSEGKLDFENFLTAIRDSAARFAADSLIQSLFQPKNSTTGDSGGLVTQAASWISTGIKAYFGYASGGVVSSSLPHGIYSSPTLFPMTNLGHHAFAAGTGLLGEAGPEAVLPLSRGSDGKLGVTATTSAPQVNVIVNNLPGQAAEVQQQPDGSTMINIVKASIMNDISKGGTKFSKTFETTYGGLRRGR